MKPIVLTAGRRDLAASLNASFPGRAGLLFSPGDWRPPRDLPYALDNGRFPVWSRGAPWDEGAFWKLMASARAAPHPPRWVAVPDVVADAGATLAEWRRWQPQLKALGWPLALVVQDGMLTADALALDPDVIFVGGTARWKWRTLPAWCRAFPRVHVGRVNTPRLLWVAHRAGAESSDGTGWWHRRQLAQLRTYLALSGDVPPANPKGLIY